MSETSSHRATVASALAYKDPEAAIGWLSKAFGFDIAMVIRDDSGQIIHSEMGIGNGYVMIGNEWREHIKAPGNIGGANTQTVHIQLTEDIDAHCERARAAGAVIDMEPETQFYGDRTYRAFDPEGHMWTFAQTIELKTNEQMEAALPGIKISDTL
jgi:uncharacterized glyoxalase superfamily protein PhnB